MPVDWEKAFDELEEKDKELAPERQRARAILNEMFKQAQHERRWERDDEYLVAMLIKSVRGHILEEAAKRIEQYMRTDKYGSKEEGRYYLINAASLVRSLKK